MQRSDHPTAKKFQARDVAGRIQKSDVWTRTADLYRVKASRARAGNKLERVRDCIGTRKQQSKNRGPMIKTMVIVERPAGPTLLELPSQVSRLRRYQWH